VYTSHPPSILFAQQHTLLVAWVVSVVLLTSPPKKDSLPGRGSVLGDSKASALHLEDDQYRLIFMGVTIRGSTYSRIRLTRPTLSALSGGHPAPICHDHVQPFVDQAVASDPESQIVPDYLLTEIQQADANDGYLAVLRPASQLKPLS